MFDNSIRFAMAQIDTSVGDIQGNSDKVVRYCAEAARHGADVVVFPEMSLTGYPIDDLTFRDSFRRAASNAGRILASRLQDVGLGDLTVIVGTLGLGSAAAQKGKVWYATDHNRLCAIRGGEIVATYDKHFLPTYGVFDELRLFAPGNSVTVLDVKGRHIGVAICEDIWRDGGTVAELADKNLDMLVSINGSPYNAGKMDTRYNLVHKRATEIGAPMMYLNQVGAQDDLVFDGGSFVMSPDGTLLEQSPQYREDLSYWTLPATESASLDLKQIDDSRSHCVELGCLDKQMYDTCVLGLRDYARKNGLDKAVLGLSGGIDSALTATVAVDALGANNVWGISMPSQFSSNDSKTDAEQLASNLGCHYVTEPIGELFDVFQKQLSLEGIAKENLQARIRGVILMGYANRGNMLALDTTNKSEFAVGYFTLYGDACGGYAPLVDIYKTQVYRLARWRNDEAIRRGETAPIPQNSIDKPASAELREGQRDSDSLPPYNDLDAVLSAYIEGGEGRADMLSSGFSQGTVDAVMQMVDRAEWKRRQAPQGPKVSSRALKHDRQIPVSQHFQE